MAELAAAGLTPAQLALVMELSAVVAAEARPTVDRAAENKRSYDREYRRTHSRTISYDNNESNDPAPNERDNLTPTRERKTKPKGLSKSLSAIPDDWEPLEFTIGTESRKVVDGWPPGELPAQVEQFRAHHSSKNNSFSDPQKAWSTWVLNTRKWGIGRHERSNNPTSEAVHRILGSC